MSRIKAIRPFGQQIWLDYLSRELLASGTLQHWIEHDGISGITSNPAIFQHAITHDPRYHADRDALRQRSDLSPEQRYEALVLPDVRAACEALLPLYERSHGKEGYVSFEVSPLLAHDELGTLTAARRLWHDIARPNAMIKIPATPAGIAAQRTLIAEGLNINMTLLFSAAQVEATWSSYLSGLRQRVAQGHTSNMPCAVASFFLSRIDSRLDPRLPPELAGKTAIALARTLYRQHYQAYFHHAAFADLRALGATPQYLLWASTGTKNTSYSPVLYVESLIGKETINTVPEATLHLFQAHGTPCDSLQKGIEADTRQLAAIEALSIDLEYEGEQLQAAGLKLFEQAFHQLMTTMEIS